MSRPYYIDRESEFLPEQPVGTEVICSWGAMFADVRGTVAGYDSEKGHLIAFGDGGSGWYAIRATRSVNGSPIGAWLA